MTQEHEHDGARVKAENSRDREKREKQIHRELKKLCREYTFAHGLDYHARIVIYPGRE